MNLDALDLDALTELFNIGLHRAASSLSELAGQRIIVDLPQLWVTPVEEMHDRLETIMVGELATVHQIFKGRMTGDAVLVLEYESATKLADLLTQGGVALDGRLDQSAREVLAEVGNVILSSCLSVFGDMLKVSVSFSVARVQPLARDGDRPGRRGHHRALGVRSLQRPAGKPSGAGLPPSADGGDDGLVTAVPRLPPATGAPAGTREL